MGRTTLKEKIHDELLARIIKNKFSMQEFLKEGVLAKEFGVSKAPVREALIELCNEGVIRNIPRSGYQIIQLTERDIREATQFRLILEIEGLKLAADNINEDNLEELRIMTESTDYINKGKIVSLEEWWDNNEKFHLKINSIANNSLLTDSLKRTIHLLWRAVTQLFWKSDPKSYLNYNSSSHVPIYQALRDGNMAQAEAYLRSDILSILDSFSRQYSFARENTTSSYKSLELPERDQK
ncbi:GntR family transcriptional regulator [Alkalispirochaeta alkalica]|uniref:GntR family transcriptional regulator n=1 Tax=Alkalispirochaeta alkalica TaxID=46356 RepID=UPI000688796F|nr:GntR family transcriptional regulator [Alkalispirochaeta alkalica]